MLNAAVMIKPHIGIYAGTFDPIHQGHIAFARAAMEQCNLDKVIFLPERNPRGKQQVTAMSHRIRLIELAIDGFHKLCVIELGAEQFTVGATIAELNTMFSGASLSFLIGSDVARSLRYWEHIDKLLDVASLIIGIRSSDTPASIRKAMAGLEQLHGTRICYTLLATPEAAITSSQIRSGSGVILKLPLGIRRYIAEHGLYSSKKGTVKPSPISPLKNVEQGSIENCNDQAGSTPRRVWRSHSR